jgi:hypothetical protein
MSTGTGLGSRRAIAAAGDGAAKVSSSRPAGFAIMLAVVTVALCLVFGVGVASAVAPSFTVDPTPTVSYTTAQVSGTIDPAENEVFYVFQYAAHPETEGWAAGPLIFTQTLAASSGSNSVSEELTGLKPGTKYQLRLWALITDFSQEWTSPEPYVTFETEAVAAPTATLEPIATHTSTTAHFSGTVNPNAPAGALSEAAKAAYTTEWHFECTPECPGLTGGTIEAEEGSQPVSVNATGLEPNTAYEVRLVASNADGPSTATESFSTDLILPDVKTEAGGSDDKGGYILQGIVNAHNSEIISCHFEYGPTTAYGQEAACIGAPGTGNKPVEVTAHLSGLTPGATYHFQLSATNGAGPESSGDATFLATMPSSASCPNEAIREEQHSTSLPECRAYELVTSASTEGFGVVKMAFSDESAVAYSAFAGNIANSGAGDGSGGNRYVSKRTGAGWQTVADLNGPSQSIYADPEAFSPCGCVADIFSADLQSTVWYMGKTGISDIKDDIYLRRPDGSFALIGPYTAASIETPEPGPPGHSSGAAGSPVNYVIGVSADLSHYVFMGEGSTLGSGLWEYAGTGNALPRRVDVDSSGSPVSSCGIVSNISEFSNAMSSDGRVIYFTAAACGTPAANEVWARVDGTTSYDVSASLCTRTSADPGGACNAPADAAFAGAAVDGSRIYVTTAQQLVNGDTNETTDLYEYDLPTAATPHPSPALVEVSGVSGEADVEGVVNVSDDGSRVYFVAAGILAANADSLGESAASGDHNLYVWERDASHPAAKITFIGRLEDNDVCLWGAGPRLCVRRAQGTADGRYLLLPTTSPLVVSDTDASQDMYRYDAATGAMVRVSTNVNGVGGNSEGLDAEAEAPPFERQGTAGFHRSRVAVSNDGQAIVFSTSESLSPADTNGVSDVYLWKAGRVSLVSSGRWPAGATNASIDAQGQNIYFETSEPLTPDDGDTVLDLYDARVGGGFGRIQASSCSGEGCQSALSGPPAGVGAPGTASLSGAGNVATPVSIKARTRPLSKAQKLTRALRGCKRDRNKHKRAACEARARKRYRAKSAAQSHNGGNS